MSSSNIIKVINRTVKSNKIINLDTPQPKKNKIKHVELMPINLSKKNISTNINYESNNYIIVKAWGGFGNMISTLSYCFNLALDSKRKIVIDWKNSLWNDEFDNYFSLPNNIYINFNKFINENNIEQNVFPPIFINNLNKSIHDVYPNNSFKGNSLYHAINKVYDDKIKIVVLCFNYTNIGYQHFYNFWKNLKINKNIIDLLNVRKKILNQYYALHIRNTDQQQINFNWIDEFLHKFKNINVYIATDDKNIINYCKSKHPKIFNFTTLNNNNVPLHLQSVSNQNQQYNKNVELIIDLLLLSNSIIYKYADKLKYKQTYNSSSFSILAQKIYDYDKKLPDKQYNYISFTI